METNNHNRVISSRNKMSMRWSEGLGRVQPIEQEP